MSLNDIGGPRAPHIPNPPSHNVPPPPKPLPDVANAVEDILRGGSPEPGQPGKGLTGGISGGPIADIFEDGSQNKLPGGLTGGISASPLAGTIGSAIRDSAKDINKSVAGKSGNNLLGGPDTFNALEVQMKLGKLKIRI